MTLTLITGANKGIGFEVAQQLAKAGHTVLMTARDAGRGEAAAAILRAQGLDVVAIQLDQTKPDSIAAAAATVTATHGHIDVLINNAGINVPGDGPAMTADIAAVQAVMNTNFFGPLMVTQAFLPLLRKSTAGHIINVSSDLGSLTLNSDPTWKHYQVKPVGYNSAKAALNMMTVHLAALLKDDGIRANSANPGYTATDLNGNSGPQTIEEGAEAIVRLALSGSDGPTGQFFDRHGTEPW